MKEPLVYLLKILLRRNNISVNEEELEFQILSHPSYPSLHAVTGVLDHFAVNNYALEVPKHVDTLNLLPSSFLALIHGDKDNGYALVSKHDHGFQLSFGSDKSKIVTVDYFLEVWTGVIVIVESDKQEVVVEGQRLNLAKITSIATIISFVAIFFFNGPDLFQAIHFLLTLLGVAICVLIVQHELGFHSKVLDRFCSEESKKTSCNAVLNSKGATLFGSFKFSDIGIVYFVSLVFLWLLIIMGNASTVVLITALAIPFTLYSIYYQYRVVRKWCPLCLSVVTVLWLQAASLSFVDSKIAVASLTLNGVLLAAFSFLATFALWQFIAPILKKEQELSALKIEHFKFKRSFNIFKSLSSGVECIDTDIAGSSELVFGDRSDGSPLKVVVITNPLCGFCKEAHELVENLLKRKDRPVQVTIRFNVSEDPNSIDRKIALRLIEIYKIAGDQVCLEAMHEVYGKFSPAPWLLKWEEPSEKYSVTLANSKH